VTAVTPAPDVFAWLSGQADRVLETSCARIYLAGESAWKVKRPVNFGFLDFTTLAGRKWALERELAFNRRFAPHIYRAVRPITLSGAALAIDGQGEVVEWLLEMKRFDPEATLANPAQDVDGALAETLGRLIARTHAEAPAALDGGGVAALSYTTASNAQRLRASGLKGEAVERLIARTAHAQAAAAPLLETRRRQGFARHCHGDLHLGNILMEDGAPVLFDCLEFNDSLSRIDTLYDLAFPLMDLCFRGRAAAANRLFNAYLDEAARAEPGGLWDGLAVLPLLLATRAAVRAHVSAASGDREAAGAYLEAAISFLGRHRPRLVAVGGLSGSGKTTLARALAPRLDGAPGAVVVRSDEVRKRLAGLAPRQRAPDESYDAAGDAQVQRAMLEIAHAVLSAGRAVVLDATFLDPAFRTRAAHLARELGAPFTGVWLEEAAAELRLRLAARRGDASDACVAVLERQLARETGPVTWRRIGPRPDLERTCRALAEGIA
jgi:hypothetical protein